MECDVAREALSARIDGEREPVPAVRVDEHLASCAGCCQWYARAVEQTQELRRLVGRSHVAAVREPRSRPPGPAPLRAWATATLRRWALALIGVLQVALAVAQGLGTDVGLRAGGHAMMSGHLLNESTAWSAALGVVMVVAAWRPAAAPGLAAVLAVFCLVLTGFVIKDAAAGAVTAMRLLSHLPVLVGTVLAVLVWRATRPTEPTPGADAAPDDVVLPDNATRGRRRGHLHPTDGSAA